MSASNINKPHILERIIIGIGFLERRIVLMSDAIFDPNQTVIIPGQNNDFDFISDDIYYFKIGRAHV